MTTTTQNGKFNTSTFVAFRKACRTASVTLGPSSNTAFVVWKNGSSVKRWNRMGSVIRLDKTIQKVQIKYFYQQFLKYKSTILHVF